MKHKIIPTGSGNHLSPIRGQAGTKFNIDIVSTVPLGIGKYEQKYLTFNWGHPF